MRRCGIEDLVLGQPTPTTSASVQRQLCGKVTYSRSRPEAVADQRPLWVFGVSRRLSRSANAPAARTLLVAGTGKGQI